MSAVISACGQYRYRLDRCLDCGDRNAVPAGCRHHFPRVVWCMRNPSTADASASDPTLRRVLGFSYRGGFRRVTIVNRRAWRATDPRQIPPQPTAEECTENNAHVRHALEGAAWLICGWGTNRREMPTASDGWLFSAAMRWDVQIRCLGKNADNSPRHPLYVAASTPVLPW